jgi:hypothetical protein
MGFSVFPSRTSQYDLAVASGQLRWIARIQSLGLASLRGILNFAIVAAALVHVGCPLLGSLGQALAAGGQSAVLQLTPVNQSYQSWLHRAPNERQRFARWLTVGAVYLAVMKTAGLLAGISPGPIGKGAIDLLGTVALSTVQYPWVTAIARARARSQSRSSRRRHLDGLVADAQTLAISVFCVGASAVSSVGAGFGRAILVLIGVAGAWYRWGASAPDGL